MKNEVDTFYNELLPELLHGMIDCGIYIRSIANIYFVQNNNYLKASAPIECLDIPTLYINNNEELDIVIKRYVNIMMNSPIKECLEIIDDECLPKYFLASAIVNMQEKDYKNPESYFNELCYIHNNNPIPNEIIDYGTSEILNGNLIIDIHEELPTQECPFSFNPQLKIDIGTFKFPTIRYYIIDNRAYIGAIQNTSSSKDELVNNKVRRKLYKANSGIDNTSTLIKVDPAVVCSLMMFISFLKKKDINTIELIPYNNQRSNDKKIKKYYLSKGLETKKETERSRVIEIIKHDDLYFERIPIIINSLNTAIKRMHYHLESSILNDNSIDYSIISNINNSLLYEIYNTINKKQDYHK